MTTTPSCPDSSISTSERDPVATATRAVEGRARVRLILVLGAITALGPFTVDMYLSAFPFIAADLRASGAIVQLTLTASLVGFATGQLIIGPLSDAVGRRRPLVVGSIVHVAASLGCAVAPNIEVLSALRLLQGFGAAAGSVLAMAVVRDLFDGHAAAVMLSRLMLVMGVAPILAPTIGGFVVAATSWRAIFLVLAVLGAAVVVLGATLMPETLPPDRRRRARIGTMARTYRLLCSDGRFARLVLVCGAGRMLMFSYIAASPFVLQNQFELDPRQFGIFFACGAAVLITSSQANVVLLRRWSPRTLLLGALTVGTVTSGAFLVVAVLDVGGLLGYGVPVLVLLGVMGTVMPNAPAIALSRHPESAGTAAALVGGAQFAFAAAAAPLVGLLGNDALATASMMGSPAAVALLLALGKD